MHLLYMFYTDHKARVSGLYLTHPCVGPGSEQGSKDKGQQHTDMPPPPLQRPPCILAAAPNTGREPLVDMPVQATDPTQASVAPPASTAVEQEAVTLRVSSLAASLGVPTQSSLVPARYSTMAGASEAAGAQATPVDMPASPPAYAVVAPASTSAAQCPTAVAVQFAAAVLEAGASGASMGRQTTSAEASGAVISRTDPSLTCPVLFQDDQTRSMHQPRPWSHDPHVSVAVRISEVGQAAPGGLLAPSVSEPVDTSPASEVKLLLVNCMPAALPWHLQFVGTSKPN